MVEKEETINIISIENLKEMFTLLEKAISFGFEIDEYAMEDESFDWLLREAASFLANSEAVPVDDYFEIEARSPDLVYFEDKDKGYGYWREGDIVWDIESSNNNGRCYFLTEKTVSPSGKVAKIMFKYYEKAI